jgi:beta-glucosidase
MCAYNRVNGVYACEHPYLLADTLRGRWGFEGLVMSDWGATHSVVPAGRAGLDLEMPTPEHLSVEALAAALEAGELGVGDVDGMVRRILGSSRAWLPRRAARRRRARHARHAR